VQRSAPLKLVPSNEDCTVGRGQAREKQGVLPAGAAWIVRVLSVGLLSSLVPVLYLALRDLDGRLPPYAAIVFLSYGLLCVPAYWGLTARLQRERARQAAREAGLVGADALIALARELPALGTLPRMAHRLIAALREVFGAETAAVLLTDPQSKRLQTLVSGPGDKDRITEMPVLLPSDDPGLKLLARTGRPLAAGELRGRSAELDRHIATLNAHLLVPIVHQDVMIGVLALGPRAQGASYSQAQRAVLGLVAHHVSTVFENARLFASVTYEGLTGLMRREAILECLDQEIERADRYGRPLAICLVDIDHFKRVNDRFGHLAGDMVLRRVATELASGLRSADRAGRYGGEEFLVVLPETEHVQAAAAAENLRQRVERLRVPVAAGGVVGVQLSIGVVSLSAIDSERGRWTEELIAAADRALYRAKDSGRNRVESGFVPASVVAELRQEAARARRAAAGDRALEGETGSSESS